MATTAGDVASGFALQMSNVSVAYGGIRALSGIDLTVGSHEFMAVIGPNGAGKSTLLNAVSGLSRGSVGGSIQMFGTRGHHPARRPDRASRRRPQLPGSAPHRRGHGA